MTPLSRSIASAWRVPPKPNHAEWVPKHVRMPDETETPGPFDISMFPHVMGVIDWADEPDKREAYLPWASRLGKTITCVAILQSLADQAPRPSMIARENINTIDDLIRFQAYPMFDACRKLRPLLPPLNRRDPKHGIRLKRMRIRRAYSGSPSTMAGFPACYALASEVSKWQKKASTEADPIWLFRKRGMLFPFDSKYMFESTPGTKGECNITTLCDAPGVDIRRREVPCPHCGTYQELRFGSGRSGPGLKWERKGGMHDPAHAEETAFYECVNGCKIESGDRPDMLRKGVWLSEGQKMTKTGKIQGKRPNASAVAFGHPVKHPFGSLHSLMVNGWGQLAREWCQVKDNPEGRREFYNQTLGQSWDPQPVNINPDDVIMRMRTTEPLGICPEWSRFLTVGVDLGRTGDTLLFYWWVSAWGNQQRGQLVNCGLTVGAAEFEQFLRSAEFPHADKGPPLRPCRWMFDSGSLTQQVYDFVDSLKRQDCFCIKGSSDNPQNDFSDDKMLEMYRMGMRRAGVPELQLRVKVLLNQYDLIVPNTRLGQRWIQLRLDGGVTCDNAGWYSIPEEAFFVEPIGMPGQSLMKHLIGDMEDERGRWVKRWERQDLRDAWRYSMVGAFHRTNNGTGFDNLLPRSINIATPRQRPKPANAFLASDRK